MKKYYFTVSMLGHESVGGTVEAANPYIAQCHALMRFESANDLYFRDVNLLDRLMYYSPKVWK